MPIPNNPATRLAVIMENLRSQAANQSIRESFMNILNCHDEVEFFRAFGYLQRLPETIETAVQQYVDPEHYELDQLLAWRGPIEDALLNACSLNSATSNVTNKYQPSDIAVLKHCGYALSAAGVERRVDQETFDQLRSLIQALEDELMASEGVPNDLKDFILEQLDRIRRALRDFNLRGPEALNEILEQVTGSVIANRDVVIDANEESQSVIAKLGDIISLVEKAGNAATSLAKGVIAATGAYGVVMLAISGQQALPPPTSPPVAEQPSAPAIDTPHDHGDAGVGGAQTER
ncbi:hypothetical protein AB0346_22975 [Nocardia beijingensis]|uniref:hypothetical protein n=1 Tax=Nocardia beijingensis TaxID=95162 RepID=UPI00344BBDDD